jgi:hypothetical protein
MEFNELMRLTDLIRPAKKKNAPNKRASDQKMHLYGALRGQKLPLAHM